MLSELDRHQYLKMERERRLFTLTFCIVPLLKFAAIYI